MIRRTPWFVRQREQRAARAGSLRNAMLVDELLMRQQHLRAVLAHHQVLIECLERALTHSCDALPGEDKPAPERLDPLPIPVQPSWRTH